MRVVKERVESWLDVANKKVEDLQSQLQKIEEDAKMIVKEERRSKEAAIQATIEAEKIHFRNEQMGADNAQAEASRVENTRKQIQGENSKLKECAESTEESYKKLEKDQTSAFEEGVYSFIFSTWLQHFELDFSFLGSMYANQIAEWNADPSIQEGRLRDRENQHIGSNAPRDVQQDPPTEDPEA